MKHRTRVGARPASSMQLRSCRWRGAWVAMLLMLLVFCVHESKQGKMLKLCRWVLGTNGNVESSLMSNLHSLKYPWL
ncbi:hypothetical protein MTO96_013138 [Rhipicephalus appendiculatus]